MKFGTPLPAGVFQRFEPPLVSNEDAFKQLNTLLIHAVERLIFLDQNPVVVAASPNRFDDADNYEWIAVRCGDFFSETGSYMNRHNLDRDLLNARAEAKSAHTLLQELESAGWRDLFAKAYDIKWSDQSLSLVLQDDLAWLVFSSNNASWDGGDHVFAIWEDAEMEYFGEAEERFDWAIQNKVPLIFLDVEDYL